MKENYSKFIYCPDFRTDNAFNWCQLCN